MNSSAEVSEELRDTVDRLHKALIESPQGSDLLISSFVAALKHFRRATIATPFPTELFQTPRSEKDFEACLEAALLLPSLQTLVKASLGGSSAAVAAIATANLACLPPPSRKLLEWLVLPTSRRRIQLQQTSLSEFCKQLKEIKPGCALPTINAANSPNFILKNMAELPHAKQGTPVVAYHGTSFERLHSILNTGLLNMSGTRLQGTGAIFGEGIYMSTDLDVSLTFCQPAVGWSGSALGHKLRCLLVCMVDKDLTSEDRPPDETRGGEKLPGRYLLIGRADAIRLLYVFIYQDMAKEVKSKRINWCTVVIVVYIACMLMHHLFNMKAVERWFRHQLRGY